MKNPKVSVVMSVYNGVPYLPEAIESILTQTYNDFEFIVIDDGSNDGTADILCSYDNPRIKLVHQKNRGLPASLNRGIQMSEGKYIARMDADDISEPDRLACQVQYLDSHPDCVMLGTCSLMIDQEGQTLCMLNMPQDQETILSELDRCSSPFVHGSVMFRKSAAVQCSLYDERMLTAQDWLLWLNMAQIGRMTNLAATLYRRRLTANAITMLTPQQSKLKMSILKKIRETGGVTIETANQLLLLVRNKNTDDCEAYYYLGAAKMLIERDWQPARARRYIWQSIRLNPWYPTTWVNLAFCFMPRLLVSAWKRRRIDRLQTDVEDTTNLPSHTRS
jgi:glycosyltransferase involved in cell wall biosynthesis